MNALESMRGALYGLPEDTQIQVCESRWTTIEYGGVSDKVHYTVWLTGRVNGECVVRFAGPEDDPATAARKARDEYEDAVFAKSSRQRRIVAAGVLA